MKQKGKEPQYQAMATYEDELPSISSFSFEQIFRSIEPEVRCAVDVIAEICARSHLSLANEYSAHLPPLGDMVDREFNSSAMEDGSVAFRNRTLSDLGRPMGVLGGHRTRALETALTAVSEVSSSSAGESCNESTESENNRNKPMAYGSLKSIISGSGEHKRGKLTDQTGKSNERISNTVVPSLVGDADNKIESFPTIGTGFSRIDHPRRRRWSILGSQTPSITILAPRLSLSTTPVNAQATTSLSPHEDKIYTGSKPFNTERSGHKAGPAALSWMPWAWRDNIKSNSLPPFVTGEVARGAEARLKVILRVAGDRNDTDE